MEKTLYPLRGIVTVLNTPFTADDTVALPALARHAEAAIQAGVAGFLVPAMAAEVYKLSEAERRAMVETVVATSAGRVPVIGGAGAADGAQRLRVARAILAAGCPNLLLQIPFTNAADYREAVLRVAELGPDLIMLQDWDFGGGGLPLELICQLFEEVESFRCLKIETTPAARSTARSWRRPAGGCMSPAAGPSPTCSRPSSGASTRSCPRGCTNCTR